MRRFKVGKATLHGIFYFQRCRSWPATTQGRRHLLAGSGELLASGVVERAQGGELGFELAKSTAKVVQTFGHLNFLVSHEWEARLATLP